MSGHRTARVLVYTHRWLGIASGVLFIIWFVSGIVMIHARMPELDPAERLARLPAINPASIRVMPTVAGDDITRLAIATLEGRPVIRVTARGPGSIDGSITASTASIFRSSTIGARCGMWW